MSEITWKPVDEFQLSFAGGAKSGIVHSKFDHGTPPILPPIPPWSFQSFASCCAMVGCPLQPRHPRFLTGKETS